MLKFLKIRVHLYKLVNKYELPDQKLAILVALKAAPSSGSVKWAPSLTPEHVMGVRSKLYIFTYVHTVFLLWILLIGNKIIGPTPWLEPRSPLIFPASVLTVTQYIFSPINYFASTAVMFVYMLSSQISFFKLVFIILL